MPTYEYACTRCGEHLEVVQSMSSEPLTECPACGGRLRKVFSPIGIVFKGSGFYRTDSRKDGKAGTRRTDKPADKPAADKTTSGSSSGDSSTSSSGSASSSAESA